MATPVFGQNKIRTGVRIIKLVSFTSGHVVDCYDDGCDESGRPNQQRQHLVNLLRKRVRVAGVELRMWLLAEPPPAWQMTGKEKIDAIRQADRFDTESLRNTDGDWLMPTPKWIEMSAKAQELDRKIAQEQADVVRAKRAARGLEGITLLQQIAANVAAPAAPVAKPAPGKGAP